MAGHMFATALAAVTIKPRGLVEGAGADEVLARAAYHVERGDLPKAVHELDALTVSSKGAASLSVCFWKVQCRVPSTYKPLLTCPSLPPFQLHRACRARW